MKRLLFALVLVAGCVTPQTGRQAYAVALGLYTAAANSMAAYCMQADKRAAPECVEARGVASQAQGEIDTVTQALRAGTATETLLSQAAAALDAYRMRIAAQGGN